MFVIQNVRLLSFFFPYNCYTSMFHRPSNWVFLGHTIKIIINVLNKTVTFRSLHLPNLTLINLGQVSDTEPHGELTMNVRFVYSNNHGSRLEGTSGQAWQMNKQEVVFPQLSVRPTPTRLSWFTSVRICKSCNSLDVYNISSWRRALIGQCGLGLTRLCWSGGNKGGRGRS